MIVRVDLNTAIEFTSYDAARNLIRVHSTELEEKHIGVHNVTVIATMIKDRYSEKEYINSFLITVLPPIVVEITPAEPVE